jgi:hypothetical protein
MASVRVKYLGHADDEKLRLMLAAANLYQRAINQVGLTHDSHVWQRIEATARAMHVPVQPVSLEVPIDNPKQYVRDLSAIPSAGEVDCLGLQSAWLEVAEKAIADNVSTVAVLSMTELLKPDGWLAIFRARGYEIIEP